ncbi:MAG: prepilin-type N-terminal cleavage/methylation domain-containing protein [Phycisphaerae bacterium]
MPVKRPDNTRTSRRQRRGGFTLSELMIALGILAYGLTMSASLFTTAMKFSNASFRDVVGTIMCENGVALIRARLTEGDLGGVPVDTLTDISNKFDDHDLLYPTGDTDSLYGLKVLAKRVSSGENDFQFVILAYKKNRKGNNVDLRKLSGKIANHGDEQSKFTSGSIPGGLLPDSPFVRGNGAISYVDGISGNTVILRDRMEMTGTMDVDAFVLVESGSDIANPTGLAAFAVRMGVPVK